MTEVIIPINGHQKGNQYFIPFPQTSIALCSSLYHRVESISALSEAILALFSLSHTVLPQKNVMF